MRQPRNILRGCIVLGFALLFLAAAVETGKTYPQYLQQAQSMGLPARDCRYCHATASGGDTFNARGKWLVAETRRRGASSVDVNWLRDYGKKTTKTAPATTPATTPKDAANSAEKSVRPGATASPSSIPVRSAGAVGVVVGREPVRALSGRMKNNRIETRLANDRRGFDYLITGAEVVDGRLQLKGMVMMKRSAALGTIVPATLIGTLSQARNPWPSAESQRPVRPANQQPGTQNQPQGREARNPETAAQLGQLSQATQPTARTTETPTAPQGERPAAGEANEQTQSLYSSADVGLGCEITYLKMELPAALRTAVRSGEEIQVGVVLHPIDNKKGEEINNQLCRVVHALNSGKGAEADEQLAQLNRLLASQSGGDR